MTASKRKRGSADDEKPAKRAARSRGADGSGPEKAEAEPFRWGIIIKAMMPPPRRMLDLPYKGNANEPGIDRVAYLATMISLHWERLGAMPTGTRARILDQLIRDTMAETRGKPRSNPRTRSKRDLIRARYVAECEQTGTIVSRADFARRMASEYSVQQETVVSYLKGISAR